jgi:hypothetical protein
MDKIEIARFAELMKVGRRIVLIFGFEKKDQANIKANELRAFRKAARVYLSYSEEEMKQSSGRST